MINEGSLGKKRALRRLKALDKLTDKRSKLSTKAPWSERENYNKRINNLGFDVEKTKMKSLFRAVSADMDRTKPSDTKAYRIASNIEDIKRTSERNRIKRDQQFYKTVLNIPAKDIEDYHTMIDQSSVFLPKHNITQKIGKVLQDVKDFRRYAPSAIRALQKRKPSFAVTATSKAAGGMSSAKRGPLGSEKFLRLATSSPGGISLKNIAVMMGRINRSREAGAAAKMNINPENLPQYKDPAVQDLTGLRDWAGKKKYGNHDIQEADVKGQMHFDFDAAQKEAEQKRREEEIRNKREENEETYRFKRPTVNQISKLINRRRKR